MEFTSYARKPFIIEAVQITKENIQDVAEFVGTVCTDANGNKYIEADRMKVPNVHKVTTGYWLTRKRKGDFYNYRCFPKHIFEAQFVESTDDLQSFPDEGRMQGAEENAERPT